MEDLRDLKINFENFNINGQRKLRASELNETFDKMYKMGNAMLKAFSSFEIDNDVEDFSLINQEKVKEHLIDSLKDFHTNYLNEYNYTKILFDHSDSSPILSLNVKENLDETLIDLTPSYLKINNINFDLLSSKVTAEIFNGFATALQMHSTVSGENYKIWTNEEGRISTTSDFKFNTLNNSINVSETASIIFGSSNKYINKNNYTGCSEFSQKIKTLSKENEQQDLKILFGITGVGQHEEYIYINENIVYNPYEKEITANVFDGITSKTSSIQSNGVTSSLLRALWPNSSGYMKLLTNCLISDTELKFTKFSHTQGNFTVDFANKTKSIKTYIDNTSNLNQMIMLSQTNSPEVKINSNLTVKRYTSSSSDYMLIGAYSGEGTWNITGSAVKMGRFTGNKKIHGSNLNFIFDGNDNFATRFTLNVAINKKMIMYTGPISSISSIPYDRFLFMAQTTDNNQWMVILYDQTSNNIYPYIPYSRFIRNNSDTIMLGHVISPNDYWIVVKHYTSNGRDYAQTLQIQNVRILPLE